jgi:hypothetical protein
MMYFMKMTNPRPATPMRPLDIFSYKLYDVFYENDQPATRNPQPATRNPQPATRNPQPATRKL